ncbi:hypothetical protein [Streptomyces sp. G-G2]|uniref:hypothetical protein n=1 Tax=Streptomyces sp. G-G2 TaxID=3046201 RepID=UPI0024B95F72|nr:hypothetical protein [Streptomyces sp. G-G2]MDJ0386082.1 hypothetical protein [Streptomyces sp. G-G2]
MTGPEQWRTLWKRYEEPKTRNAVTEACSGLASFTESGCQDPADTIALAIVGAEASERLRGALESDWALYTPQQAAVVASALFAQLNATTDAFESLRRLLQHAEDRRETAFTAEADAHLRNAAAAVAFTCGFGPGVVNSLNAGPDLSRLPADAHETLTVVAALLGPAAKVTENHGPGEYIEDDRGLGCGCEIRFEHRGQGWNFHWGNCCWNLVREEDGEVLEDSGNTGWNELGSTDSTAHPQHLLALIRAKLDETS